MKTTNKFFALALMAVAMVFASCSKEDNDPVGPSQQEIETKIVGKWKRTIADGKELLTNHRDVFTFAQNGVGTHSMSTFQPNENRWVWSNKLDMVYSVANNAIRIKEDVILDISVDKIEESQMLLTVEYVNGQKVDIKDDKNIVFTKISADYSQDIIGMWEGIAMTGYETYGDYHHRIEYRADGTYTYYNWDESTQTWKPLEDVFDEWNVDGDWLATRWQNKGSDVMNYEWWDIDYIKGDEMKWSALREKEDGTRFTTTFTWKKVVE